MVIGDRHCRTVVHHDLHRLDIEPANQDAVDAARSAIAADRTRQSIAGGVPGVAGSVGMPTGPRIIERQVHRLVLIDVAEHDGRAEAEPGSQSCELSGPA